jgi:transposase
LTKNNKFESYSFETTINAQKLVEIFDDFAQKTTKKTIVIMDNAPIHKSKIFLGNVERWQLENDLYLFFLPTYSPELNLIEILWRKIKYKWLDFMAYLSFQNLKENLNSVLKSIGTKFNIHFV